jgi:hypothetical protein
LILIGYCVRAYRWEAAFTVFGGAVRQLGGFFPNFDEAVKSQKPDGFEKSSSYGAQISKSEEYLCTPQRFRDAAQRRDWAFCGTVNFDEPVKSQNPDSFVKGSSSRRANLEA